ncbi:MAG: tripartite tricarboxylate transporter substrate binding protein [Thermodesulfobacteriota bacterium]
MKKFIFVLILTVFCFGLSQTGVWAYPEKPIKLIIGYEAGSATDLIGRTFFKLMEKELGQPFMIVNKPGAASALALRELLDAKADGYTLGMSCSVNVLKIMGQLPKTHHDFDVIGIPLLTGSVLAVPAKSPFQSTKELVDYARSNPEKLRLSTTSKGAVFWIHSRYFERLTGAKFNLISNPGGASFIATQLGGAHADLGFAAYRPLQGQIKAGNIRLLGVTTEKRVAAFPDLPTLKEQGYNMIVSGWASILAPKGLPPDIYKKLVAAHAKLVGITEWQDFCNATGSVGYPEYTGEGAIKFMDQDAEIQKPILEEIGAVKK